MAVPTPTQGPRTTPVVVSPSGRVVRPAQKQAALYLPPKGVATKKQRSNDHSHCQDFYNRKRAHCILSARWRLSLHRKINSVIDSPNPN